MLFYIFIFVILISLALAYSRIAKYFNITDIPNERSSHSFEAVRGGGVIFFIAILIFFFISDYQYPNFFIGLTIVSILSFTDDIYTLKARYRLPFQFLGIFFILNSFHIEILPIWGIIIAAIISVAFINIYNFMDGINGITGLYSLAVLQGFWILNTYYIKAVNVDLLIFSGIALLVFGFFNFRKRAKFFAGDIGSICLAGIILFVGIKFLVITKSPLILGLVAVYAIDSGFTILRRIFHGENIFHAHRQHLYQKLVHKKDFSHIQVAVGYALVQLFLNLIIYYSLSLDLNIQYLISIIVFSILSILYIILFSWTKRQSIAIS